MYEELKQNYVAFSIMFMNNYLLYRIIGYKIWNRYCWVQIER